MKVSQLSPGFLLRDSVKLRKTMYATVTAMQAKAGQNSGGQLQTSSICFSVPLKRYAVAVFLTGNVTELCNISLNLFTQ